MAKIYTKSGDDGTTSLAGGTRVQKSDALVDAYGTCDELNCFIGVVIAEIYERSAPDAEDREIIDWLTEIQNTLFEVGGILATEKSRRDTSSKSRTGHILSQTKNIEKQIDKLSVQLEPLQQFILPNGHRLIATLHVCRAVARRCERKIAVALQNDDSLLALLQYTNRLSDLFFVLARIYHRKDRIIVNNYQSVK